jgi:hypothetical protein
MVSKPKNAGSFKFPILLSPSGSLKPDLGKITSARNGPNPETILALLWFKTHMMMQLSVLLTSRRTPQSVHYLKLP